MQVVATIPVLRIFDESQAREFYVGYLGFNVDWTHRFGDDFPVYSQVSGHGTVLHLSEHHGDGTPGSLVFFRVLDLDGLAAALAARAYKNLQPVVEEVSWGRQLSLTDPFGNLLRFCEQGS